MKIQISSDGTPIYQQIFRQVQYLIGKGRLRSGEELPSIRVLASDLVVNPNTVARAYRELESAGLVTKRGTSGTFVADQGSARSESQRRQSMVKRVEQLLVDASEMGFTVEEVLECIKESDNNAARRSGGRR